MTLNRSNSNVDEADNEERLMNFSLHRAVALFLDGMSRAALLPFGPSLVYRLSHGSSIKLGLDCAKIVYRLTVVVVAYLIGRGFGGSIARKFTISDDSLPKVVARLAGAAISLHVFTFGAGLKSVWWLVIIRFISAALVGTMCVLTKEPLPVGMVDGQNQLSSTSTSTSTQLEMTTTTTEERMEGGKMVDAELQGKRRRHGYVDFASGTAKIYMTAFAVSILSGGLFYRHATGDATFQALTGSRQFTLSPLFMLVVALISEFVLRCVFAFVEKNQGEKTHEGPMRKRSSGSFSRPYNAHRRSLTLPSATIQEDIEEGLLREPPQIRSSISSSVPLELPERRDSDLFAPCRERLDSSNHSVPFSSPRRRTETTDSEFFDCNSVLSDMEEVQFFDEELGGDHPPAAESEEQPTRVIIRGMEGDGEEHKVAKYVNGKCLYGDDKPAHVPNGNSPGEVPENYLKLCSGKQHKAEAMWRETQEWRRKHNVWKIHTVPHRWFPKIKKAYPHFVHGFSKQGYPIIYEQPGKMNLKELFREGCAVSDMVRHYIFFLEFISNHICTREEVRARMGPLTPKNHNASSWGTMVVMDVKGTGLSHLSGDVLMYLKSAGDINNSHYPFSMKRAFIVNSPFWLAGAWSSIKGILPDSVQVDILSSHKYPTALREYIDDDQIPREYGGSSPYPLGQHPFELEMNKLVEEANKGSEDDDDDYDDEDVNDEPVVESTSEPTYTFDYNKNSWSTEIDGVKVSDGAPHMAGAKWTTTLTTSSSRSGQQALRRRAASTERLDPSTTGLIPFDNDLMNDDDNDDKKGNSYGGEGDIFAIVSVMYLVWCGIQGVIETAIPLWMLIPPELGGLGYAPSRSGVAMFCATMVLLWVMRTKVSKVIAKIPSKAPMRSFRIGVGAESVLLLLLATVPKTARYVVFFQLSSYLLFFLGIIVELTYLPFFPFFTVPFGSCTGQSRKTYRCGASDGDYYHHHVMHRPIKFTWTSIFNNITSDCIDKFSIVQTDVQSKD